MNLSFRTDCPVPISDLISIVSGTIDRKHWEKVGITIGGEQIVLKSDILENLKEIDNGVSIVIKIPEEIYHIQTLLKARVMGILSPLR